MDYWENKLKKLIDKNATDKEYNNLLEAMLKDEDVSNTQYTNILIAIQKEIAFDNKGGN